MIYTLFLSKWKKVIPSDRLLEFINDVVDMVVYERKQAADNDRSRYLNRDHDMGH